MGKQEPVEITKVKNIFVACCPVMSRSVASYWIIPFYDREIITERQHGMLESFDAVLEYLFTARSSTIMAFNAIGGEKVRGRRNRGKG